MTYLRLRFENLGEIIIYIHDKDVAAVFLENVPFSSRAIKWKEEVYFDTPVRIKEFKEHMTVDPGTVGFWRPENSLALFYGNNQPYGPIVKLGYILGPFHYLRWVENESEVKVEEYKDYGKEAELASYLRKEGFLAATRIWEEYPSVVTSIVKDYPIGVEIFVEDYGYIVETTPLFFFEQCASASVMFEMFKDKIHSPLRLDLNEEGYVILSAYTDKVKEIPGMLINMAANYRYLKRLMAKGYGVSL